MIITANDVLNEARDLAEEVGFDFRYTSEGVDKPERGMDCANWHDANGEKVPGCIVGTILNRLGVPLDLMNKFDTVGMVRDSIKRDDYIIELQAYKLLKVMQIAQDSGATWWSAVRVAQHLDEIS